MHLTGRFSLGLAAVLACALLGGIAVGLWSAQAAIASWTLAAVLVLLSLPITVVLALAVASTFMTRLSVNVDGYSLRPEYVMAVLLGLRAFASAAAGRRARISTEFLAILRTLSAFLLWSLAVTLVFAPMPTRSLTILIWFCFDALLLYGLAVFRDQVRTVITWGIRCAALSSVAAVGLWLTATAGGPQIGVQRDTSYGGFAAYVTSYEANILAALIVTWAVASYVLPSAHDAPRAARALQVMAAPATLATQTRAALLAFLAGMLLASFLRQSRAKGRQLAPMAGLLASLATLTALADRLPALAYKFNHLLDFKGGDGGVRSASWATALRDMHGAALVFGGGTNSYGQRHLDPTRPGLDIPSYLSNLPLQILYDTGLVGFLLILSLFITFFRHSRGWGAPIAATYLIASMATSFYWFGATWILIALPALLGSARGRPAVPHVDIDGVDRLSHPRVTAGLRVPPESHGREPATSEVRSRIVHKRAALRGAGPAPDSPRT